MKPVGHNHSSLLAIDAEKSPERLKGKYWQGKDGAVRFCRRKEFHARKCNQVLGGDN